MDTKIVKLSFEAPVHFGKGRLSDASYVCDAGTIFSALYIEALKMGCADSLLTAATSGNLTISDAFPYIGKTLYLPKPMVSFVESGTQQQNHDSREKKAHKKLAYIPAVKYQDFFTGSLDALQEIDTFNRGIGSHSLMTKVNLTYEHKKEADPYHVGSFVFANNAGIYFIIRGSYDLVPLLESLQYSGIGGERSSGYGRFKYGFIDDDPIVAVSEQICDGQKFVLLSSAAPRNDELDDELLNEAQYKLVRRGGFIQSSSHHLPQQKKRDFYVFAAGSIFGCKFSGDVFDVNNTEGAHSVYRYARALWMAV